MNPVLILVHNCLELTKRCVESVRAQDIETRVEVIDNGSTDGTREWLSAQGIDNIAFETNLGVSLGWNQGLRYFFDVPHRADHVFVVNNDTILPSWFLRTLLERNVDFVTGISVESMAQIAHPPNEPHPLVEAPDFSAFILRRAAWERIGPFDERMKNYYSDNDWHIRAHRAGVPLWNAGLPFYHERSSTLKNAPPREKRNLELQSVADSEVFYSIYGCYPWQSEYAVLFR
jgi:GT2 family glycosyltransferase